MLHLVAALHVLGVGLADRARTMAAKPQRGLTTIEIVLWAVAFIAFVGIVAAVIRAYVTKEAAKIK